MIRPVRSEWRRTLIVCRKCSRRVGGGFGDRGRTPLAKLLRKALGVKRGRKAPLGIVESRCLGLCPKRGVVVIDADAPGCWRVIEARTPVGEVVAALGLAQPGGMAVR